MSAATADFSMRRLRQDRQVGRHSPEMLRAVANRTLKLDDALKKVQEEAKRGIRSRARRANFWYAVMGREAIAQPTPASLTLS